MQADHHRLSRLWHRFIQLTHASDILSFPVLPKQSQCVPKRRTWATSTKKKKGGRGSDVRSQCQCSNNRSCSTWCSLKNQTGKGHGFQKPMAIFGKNKNWVGPSGDQKKFELSSSLETTCQSRASAFRRRRWRAQTENAFRRFIRGGSPSGRQAVPEVFNLSLRDRSCCLEAPACYSWPIRPEYNQQWRLYRCESDHRYLSEAPCQGRWGANHAT